MRMPLSGYGTNFRAPKVDTHQFSMVPSSDVPRTAFRKPFQHKTTFSASLLIPVYIEEILPGDSVKCRMTAVCRLSTPFFPLMDSCDLESWFFFVPNRLVWDHWVNFCGEQNNPADSTSYTIPQIVSPAGGFPLNSIYDYFGLPTTGQVAGVNTVSVNALPLRAYNLIVSEWFRDQNLQNYSGPNGSLAAGAKPWCQAGDGPDTYSNYVLWTPAKRHDYFTSCLPWTQKLVGPVSVPLTGNATVRTSASPLITSGSVPSMVMGEASGMGALPNLTNAPVTMSNVGALQWTSTAAAGTTQTGLAPNNLYADLSTASNVTINALRLAFAQQKFYERHARGGSRYQELVFSHFRVRPQDMRVQRPEYLGGGKTPINMVPVPQTSATGLTGGSTAFGSLSGVGMFQTSDHGFSGSFSEHGFVIGLVAVRRDQVYQQGIRALWSRQGLFDHYWPVFQSIGEQPVYNREIYADGSANDGLVFGYQEAWASYRFTPSLCTAFFNSKATTPLDAWHLAEKFASLPALNGGFIQDETNVTLQRALSAGALANNQQVLADLYFDQVQVRAMPMYSVPGDIDRF